MDFRTDEGYVTSNYPYDEPPYIETGPRPHKKQGDGRTPIIEFLRVLGTNILSNLSLEPRDPNKAVLSVNGVDAFHGEMRDFILYGKAININPMRLEYNIEVGDVVVAKYFI